MMVTKYYLRNEVLTVENCWCYGYRVWDSHGRHSSWYSDEETIKTFIEGYARGSFVVPDHVTYDVANKLLDNDEFNELFNEYCNNNHIGFDSTGPDILYDFCKFMGYNPIPYELEEV